MVMDNLQRDYYYYSLKIFNFAVSGRLFRLNKESRTFNTHHYLQEEQIMFH